MRIPALYANPAPPLTSPFLEEGIQAALADQKMELDNRIVRFPTVTDDVADVMAFLLEHAYAGVLHVSAGQNATRYQWACAVAQSLGRSTDHLCPVTRDLQRPAVRPIDCQLDTSRLKALGAPVPRGFYEVLPAIVKERMKRQRE